MSRKRAKSRAWPEEYRVTVTPNGVLRFNREATAHFVAQGLTNVHFYTTDRSNGMKHVFMEDSNKAIQAIREDVDEWKAKGLDIEATIASLSTDNAVRFFDTGESELIFPFGNFREYVSPPSQSETSQLHHFCGEFFFDWPTGFYVTVMDSGCRLRFNRAATDVLSRAGVTEVCVGKQTPVCVTIDALRDAKMRAGDGYEDAVIGVPIMTLTTGESEIAVGSEFWRDYGAPCFDYQVPDREETLPVRFDDYCFFSFAWRFHGDVLAELALKT